MFSKRGVMVPFVLLLSPLASARSPWPVAGGNIQHTGRAQIVFPANPSVAWEVVVGKFGYGGVIVTDRNGKDVIIGASHDSSFGEKAYAVDEDGNVLWTYEWADQPGVDATPFYDESTDAVYFSAQDNSVTALHASDGGLLWRNSYDSPSGSSFFRSHPTPSATGDRLFLLTDPFTLGGTADVMAIDISGSLAWSTSLGSYSHGDGAVAIDHEGNVVIVSGCFNQSTQWPAGRVMKTTHGGQVLWDHCHDTRYFFFGTPAIDDDGSIYFGGRAEAGNFMMAMNSDGTAKWQTFDVASTASPAIGPQFVYFIDTGDNLTAVHKDTGQVAWKVPVGVGFDSNRAAPVVDACGNVVAASTGGNLVAVSADGTKLWELGFEGQALSGPAVGKDGTIYVRGYKLYAFRGDTQIDCQPVIDEEGELEPAEEVGEEQADGGIEDGGMSSEQAEDGGEEDVSEETEEQLQEEQPAGEASNGEASTDGGETAEEQTGTDELELDGGSDGNAVDKEEPPSSGCGCSQAGGSGLPLVFLMFIPVLMSRRKR